MGGLAAIASLACSESKEVDDETDDVRAGERIYLERHPDGNTFTCSTCHALEEPASDGFRRPGHPIAGAPERTSFKNGRVDSFLGAVNSCLDEWMAVSQGWSEDSAEFLALRDFLGSEGAVQEISFSIAEPPPLVELMQGDSSRGKETFNSTCAVCHGADGAGTQRAPRVVGFGLDQTLVAERVRRSGSRESLVYDGLSGGRMPFWSSERLGDEELGDVAAYLSLSDDQIPNEGESDPSDAPDLPDLRVCDSSHEKVGQVATLVEFAHDVRGTVTIVDDCTLEFNDFGFDGTGINVQLYGGSDGNYFDGFSMTDDLRRTGGYEGANFRVNLPEGRSLDDLGGVSVWCVPVGANFGDGLFE